MALFDLIANTLLSWSSDFYLARKKGNRGHAGGCNAKRSAPRYSQFLPSQVHLLQFVLLFYHVGFETLTNLQSASTSVQTATHRFRRSPAFSSASAPAFTWTKGWISDRGALIVPTSTTPPATATTQATRTRMDRMTVAQTSCLR